MPTEPCVFCAPSRSRTCNRSGLSRAALPVGVSGLVVPDGLEPPLPGCRPGVVAAGPRDCLFSSGSRGTRTHNGVTAPVFETGSSSGRMTSVKFRGLESNQRPPGSEPGVTTSSNCPGIGLHKRHASLGLVHIQIGEQDLNLHHRRPPSGRCPKPGSLPLADPRECPAGIEPASPAWKAAGTDRMDAVGRCRSAKGTKLRRQESYLRRGG